MMFQKKSPKFTPNQANRLIKVLTAIRDGRDIPSLAAIDLDNLENLYVYLEDQLAEAMAIRKARENLERLKFVK